MKIFATADDGIPYIASSRHLTEGDMGRLRFEKKLETYSMPNKATRAQIRRGFLTVGSFEIPYKKPRFSSTADGNRQWDKFVADGLHDSTGKFIKFGCTIFKDEAYDILYKWAVTDFKR